jgi:sporulation protein YlmC with PRC-barrel domain
VRLSDLHRSEVLDAAGIGLGRVHDVRLIQDGPPIGTFGAALRVHTLVVGAGGIGVHLGFGRSDVRGPWLIKTLFGHLHRDLFFVPWERVGAIEPGRGRLLDLASELSNEPDQGVLPGRIIDAGLELLDRQLIDSEGRMAGNVDDLEFRWADDGGPPYVSAILAGPGALARRIGGRLGSLVASIHDRLQDRSLEGPARIDFGVVQRIGSDVRLSVPRDQLATMTFERWVRDVIIAKFPGA